MALVQSEDISRDTFDRTDCACETCKLARFGQKAPWNPEGGALNAAVIHNYSYSPRRWELKSVKGDPFSYYLGVELETDAYSMSQQGSPVWSRIDLPVAADMARPKNLWFSKTDSSVSGPEFVSVPATLTYWHRQAKKLDDMFRMLLHAGYRSHDNDRCGMHVSISRSAFEDSAHLFRFLTLLHANPAWALRMSQRSRESAERWAALNCTTAQQRRQLAERITPRETWYHEMQHPGMSNRYSALNAPHDQPRFEFRLPRGTLRLDRFFKNLEWTAGMVEYTRTCKTASAARPQPFMDYVADNVSTYPNLHAFIVERKLSKPRVRLVAAAQ